MKITHKANDKTITLLISDAPFACHGGAWKVAYADFVTAMMAFFLLMWLLNATTEEQKHGISEYFNPSNMNISENTSGAGGLLGGLTMSPEGAMASQKNPIIPQQTSSARKRGDLERSTVAQKRADAENKRFDDAAEELKKKIAANPDLSDLAEHVMVDMTPEGLRIQIIDQEGKPMFPSGSARMFDKTKTLIEQITDIVLEMPNEISIRGHTDASRYSEGATYTNWELSADRANATRRVMKDAGVPADRLNNVMGKAETLPLITDNPLDPRNRRITLLLLKEDITNPLPPENTSADEGESGDSQSNEPPPRPSIPISNPYQKTQGAVQFP